MKQFLLIILIGAFAVLAFDTFGSIASQNLGFPYYWLTVGSSLICVGIGLSASKSSGEMYAPLAGAIMGFVDSTLGWYISWIIGPGRSPEMEFTIIAIISGIIFVTLLGAVLGFIGGLIGRII